MSTFKSIESKLEAFVSKYYKNQLLRGIIFFIAIGLSYFLLSLLIEYFLWLNPVGRTVLFWSFILVETFLFFKLICIPLARLFKLSKGIDFTQASLLIGEHFPEVKDKLINTLQLKSQDNSELALASIAQRGKELEPIPFTLAIDYRKNAKYLKWAIIPLLIFTIGNFWIGTNTFSSSYTRLVNYNQAYAPPAPFSFLLSSDLKAIENEPFILRLQTRGEQIPQNVQLHLGNQIFIMKNDQGGNFSYLIDQPCQDLSFYFTANDVESRRYTLNVIRTPLITDFTLQLDYPKHTNKSQEVIHNTGNATIPEGTELTWNLKALDTDEVEWISKDTVISFNNTNNQSNTNFNFNKRIFTNTSYQISTSNTDLKRYETIDYEIIVIKDQFPKITVESKQDTLTGLTNYHYGQVSDDYGLKSLKLFYYPKSSPKNKKQINFTLQTGTIDEFVMAFPDTLQLEPGSTYEYYFQITDNDRLNGFKSSISSIFEYRKLSNQELETRQLEEQNKTIDNINKNLKDREQTQKDLDQILKLQKEKEALNYTDQERLKDFFDQQQQQDKLMQNFSEKLRHNLKDFQKQSTLDSDERKQLEERLLENEQRLKQREKALEELKKLQDKIDKEELSERLDQLAKQNKNTTKSLEQLVELTKRFYVQKKLEKITRDINELGKEQEKQGKSNEKNTSKKQESLNESFKKLEQDLNELEKDNSDLQKPMEVPKDISLQESIKKDQQEANEQLEKSEQTGSTEQQNSQSQQNAKKSQRSAGKKMQQLAKQMQMSMMQSGSEQLQEDVAMLRQILDNLLIFSFEEEKLMNTFKVIDNRNPSYSKKLVEQRGLNENFQHIDDSLFALALRNSVLKDPVNEQITNIDYSIDQSLSRLSDNRVSQGVASQQYVITGANTLADMLSEALNNMQNQLASMGPGSGGTPNSNPGSPGKGDQLQDIIMSQEQIQKQLEDAQSSQDKGKNNSSSSQSGDSSKEGEEGNQQDSSASKNESEAFRAKMYEIFKKQEALRMQLESILKDKGIEGLKENRLLKQMEQFSDDLLNQNLNAQTIQRLNLIKHQLLKLKEAAQEQGEESKRESKQAQDNFTNDADLLLQNAQKYFNTQEILNRQPLPLDHKYMHKVQEYFKDDND